jgi:predicted membrane-bound spermidine synthase
LPRIGFADTSAIVGFVALIGAVVTITTLPEPKGQSLEELTEEAGRPPTSAVALGLAHSRGLRPPPA